MKTVKKLLSVFLSFLLVFAFTPMPAYAEQSEADGVSGALASGTPSGGLAAAGVSGTSTGTGELGAATGLGTATGLETQESTYTYSVEQDGHQIDFQATGDVYLTITSVSLPGDAEDGSLDLVFPSEIEGRTVTAIDAYVSQYGGACVRSITIPASIETIKKPFFSYGYNRGASLETVTFEPGSHITTLPASFFANSHVSKVTLPDSLTAIPNSLFENCYYLESIDIPASVLSIGTKAFYNCMLETVTFHEGLQTIGDQAFSTQATFPSGFDRRSYPHFTSVELPDSLISIGDSAFEEAIYLNSVSFGTGPTAAHLQTIGDKAFYETALTGIVIPDSTVSIGASAFERCEDFYEYWIEPDGRLDGYWWPASNDYTLASIQLGSSQEASQLETLGEYAFAYAPITTIALPNALRSLGYTEDKTYYSSSGYPDGPRDNSAFHMCEKLETVIWPTAPGLDHVGGFAWSAITDETINSIPAWVTTIDDCAFGACGNLRDIVIPGSITYIGKHAFQGAGYGHNVDLHSLAFAEGTEPLVIADDAFRGAFTGDAGVTVELPARLASVGENAFAMWRDLDTYDVADVADTFYVNNKDIVFSGADDYGWADIWPFATGMGTTIYYPSDAAADSDIMKYKALVEEYEAEQAEETGVADYPYTVFRPLASHTIAGIVPAGAAVQLIVGSEVVTPAVAADGTFTYVAAEGAKVAAYVSLDGYLDYVTSPAGGQEPAALGNDWSFSVALSDFTPLSQTGALKVSLVKDMPGATDPEIAMALRASNVAVFDEAGRIVARGTTSTGAVFLAEELPAGTYTVVAFAANDYLNTISGPDDLDTLGVPASSYAKQSGVAVSPRQTTEVELLLPDFDASALATVLESGSVMVPNAQVVPGCPFLARVSYTMADGHAADAVHVSVPEGVSVLSATSAAKQYGLAGWDAEARVLTITGLADADTREGTLFVGLQVEDPGTYSITAAVSSNVAAPVGSADVSAQALELMAPSERLASATFTATVYAAPDTQVSFSIGGVPLETTATTNKLGRATANLAIPDEAASLFSTYRVEAAIGGGGAGDATTASATVTYDRVTEPLAATVHELSFHHAGQTVYLVKDDVDVSGKWYTCVVVPSAHPNLYSPTWPFTAAIDSPYPLEDTALLGMLMYDDSLRFETMVLADASPAPGKEGMTRYTYTADVAIGDGDINHNLRAGDIPREFDVYYASSGAIDERDFTVPQSSIDLLKQECAKLYRKVTGDDKTAFNTQFDEAAAQLGLQLSSAKLAEFAKDADQLFGAVDVGEAMNEVLFDGKYRHEDWDPDGLVWSYGFDDQMRADFLAFEDAMDAALAGYQALADDDMPLSGYGSADAYFAREFGFQYSLSQTAGQMEANGYAVYYDNDTGSVDDVGIPNEDGELVVPEWVGVKAEQPDYASFDEYAAYLDEAEMETQAEAGTQGAALGTQAEVEAQGALGVQGAEPQAAEATAGAATADSTAGGLALSTQGSGNSASKGKTTATTPSTTVDMKYTAEAKSGAVKANIGIGISGLDAWMSTLIDNRKELAAAIQKTDTALANVWANPTDAGKIADFNAIFGKNATSVSQIPKSCRQVAPEVSGAMKAGGGLLTALSVGYTAYLMVLSGESMRGYQDGVSDIEGEMEYLHQVIDYFNENNITNVSGCKVRIFRELEAALKYKFELQDARFIEASNQIGTAAVTVFGAAGSGIGGAVLGAAFTQGVNYASLNKATKLDKARERYLAARAERISWCQGYDFAHLRYREPAIMDPSGYVYEAVEDNRVSGVVATIYQLVEGAWQRWDAAAYDQVNDQETGEAGLFAWDVPEGSWKVVFAKDGYDSAVIDGVLYTPAETAALGVPPAWTNIGVALVSKLAPQVESAQLSEDGENIEVTFSQYMKVDAGITATVDDEEAWGTWIDVQLGRNEGGELEPMTRELHIPVPNDAQPGDLLAVKLADGVNYAGTPMAEASFTIALPSVPEPSPAPTPTPSPSPSPSPEPAPVATQPMYRLYNPNSGEHFYTASASERDGVIAAGWNDEGIGWIAPAGISGEPVYRLYNTNGGEHHYTMNAQERDGLVAAGWSYEGVGWRSDPGKTVGLYREYNPNAFANNHNYTPSKAEHDWLLSLGWRDESTNGNFAWYAVAEK